MQSNPGGASPSARARIPMMRPKLPEAGRLVPYLERIDASRIYSNFGPLAMELEARLCTAFALTNGAVVSAASGLGALVGAILATAGRAANDRPLALLPAYTFVATIVAVEQCGFQPVLADVSSEDWMLDAAACGRRDDLGRIGLVVPVSAYGRPVDVSAWTAFRAATGIPVVVDAAACFSAVAAGRMAPGEGVPICLSFHATKGFGTGEGGCVACTGPDDAGRIGRALNFGLLPDRDCDLPGTNGKMSEYQAAVGLAELDDWPAKAQAAEAAAGRLRRAFVAAGIGAQLHTWPRIDASYSLYEARDAGQAGQVRAALEGAGIESRLWYGRGLHRLQYYAGLAAGGLPVVDDLAPRLVGVPTALELDDGMAERIAGAVAGASGERAGTR